MRPFPPSLPGVRALPSPHLGARPGAASVPSRAGAPRHSLAQRAGEAAVGGAAAQAAGAEVVETVQQARALVLRVAQRAHERVSARSVQDAWTLQGREDSSRHLRGQRRTAAGRPRPRGGEQQGPGACAWRARRAAASVREGRSGARAPSSPTPQRWPWKVRPLEPAILLSNGQPPLASTSPTPGIPLPLSSE